MKIRRLIYFLIIIFLLLLFAADSVLEIALFLFVFLFLFLIVLPIGDLLALGGGIQKRRGKSGRQSYKGRDKIIALRENLDQL